MAMSLWLEGTRGELAGTGVVAVGFNTEYHITMARETLPVMNPFDVGLWHKPSVCAVRPCPELGLKPTCRLNARTSHFDPKEAFRFRSPSGSRNAHLGGAFL